MFDETTASKSILGRVKGALFGSEKEANYQKLDKAGELEKGMLAMLPDWCSDLLHNHTVFELLDRIVQVTHRQLFISQYYIWSGNKARGGAEVNQVCPCQVTMPIRISCCH